MDSWKTNHQSRRRQRIFLLTLFSTLKITFFKYHPPGIVYSVLKIQSCLLQQHTKTYFQYPQNETKKITLTLSFFCVLKNSIMFFSCAILWCFRLNKRYFYQNKVSGESQWEYPQPDVIRCDEAMDISTTPPPPPLEDDGLKSGQPEPPPPPKIRDCQPLPPPPPVIGAINEKTKKSGL